ncbi:MAG: VWA domain-containing protein, partial [Proteobacteria bacterium]|nr:VWA domain-containing protein [Pseudomonadota bacterium]
MLIGLFEMLRAHRVPVSLREWLDLIAALDRDFAFADAQEFFHLARTVLVKDERHYDRFERAFAAYFEGVAKIDPTRLTQVPADWLRQSFRRLLSEEEKAKIAALGGLDQLLEEFRKRLEEQKTRHAGGNRWIGTGGTSPFGAGGVNPIGMRVGPNGGGRSAVKVWEQRSYRALDGDADLSPRNFKLALRRLRRFAREGAAEEFDLDATIDATAREAMLDVKFRPERHNAIKVLLLLDIGGSMDDHVKVCEALFGAARAEFKRLEHF